MTKMKKPNRLGAGERSRRPVTAIVIQTTNGAEFETDNDITDEATQWLTLDIECEVFELTEVFWWVNPTAAETYQLMLAENTIANDVTNLSYLRFDSGALMVDSQRYHETQGGIKLPVIMKLAIAGRVYYYMDWTNPPGNTAGILIIRGYALVGG